MNTTPQPVVVRTICSLCGEAWESHGPNPTTLDCIRLLKASRFIYPTPYVPYVQPYRTWYSTTGNTINGLSPGEQSTPTVTYKTPLTA